MCGSYASSITEAYSHIMGNYAKLTDFTTCYVSPQDPSVAVVQWEDILITVNMRHEWEA